MATDDDLGETGVPVELLRKAEIYTHAPWYAMLLLLGYMAYEARSFRHGKDGMYAIIAATAFLFLSVVLSNVYHLPQNKYNLVLAKTETIVVVTTFVFWIGIFLYLWNSIGFSTPVKCNPIFKYLIVGLLFCFVYMIYLYSQGTRYKNADWSYNDEADEMRYHIMHVQWHIWCSFYTFLFMLSMFIVLKCKFHLRQ